LKKKTKLPGFKEKKNMVEGGQIMIHAPFRKNGFQVENLLSENRFQTSTGKTTGS
jgi:hypothetical protein